MHFKFLKDLVVKYNFKYFPDNKLTKLAHLVQFKRMLMY